MWVAWRGSHGDEADRRAATPTGLAGGVLVLAGVAVGVSGASSPPGVVAIVVAVLAVVVGGAARFSAARGATRA